MKVIKIILAVVIVGVAGFFIWTSVTSDGSSSETKLNESYQVEVQRFQQLENTSLPISPDVEAKIEEGNALINNRMAVNQEKVSELKNLNDTIEAALKVIDNSANVMNEYEDLTVRFDTIRKKDHSGLSEKKQEEVQSLIEEGQSIINNRMAVNEAKSEQLKKVVVALEAIH